MSVMGSFKEKYINPVLRYLMPENVDIQVSAFHILAAGGALVSVITGLYNYVAGIGMDAVIQNLLGAVFSVVLLVYTHRTGRYKGAMILTVVVIFIGLFTLLFFSGGGYKSGVPSFFIFAVVFTAFMLDGPVMPFLVVVELVWYGGLCFFAYHNPLPAESILDDRAFLIDVVTCQSIVSVTLAVTMFLQIRVYKRKQEELNRAVIEARKADEAKSDFLAKMSHDIRTPLNTILAMNELIVQNTSSREIKDWVNNSDVSGEILLSLINDMLDISKIESGKFRLKSIPYNPKGFFRDLADIWEVRTGSRGLDFEFLYNTDFGGTLRGDEESLLKIVNNLMGNAVKYTEEGSVGMYVSLESPDNEAGQQGSSKMMLTILVRDTGVGIAPEDIDRIFMPFERGMQEDVRGNSGTGLGLSIVSELTETMNGTVFCESNPGEGTVFTVTIPQEVDAWTIAPTADDAAREKKTEHIVAPEARILVVDDNAFNRKVVVELLAPALVQIDDVESGYEALEMVDIKDYDLVLMDLRMPGMDGEETLEKIHEEYPGFEAPIVALTADIMNGVEQRLLAHGFSGFLSKPISSSRLYDALREFVPDKVVSIQGKEEGGLTRDNLEGWQDILMAYGIDLNLALENNAGSVEELIMRMHLFENYAGENSVLSDEPVIDGNYYIQIHSLKSMAKGIGADLLSEMAAAVEFREDDTFAVAIHGILLAEYERVCRGIAVLEEKIRGE
ncbi:MAG: response regulator [Eubacterium sp.]|nr:response regulator [Eubacterium sp.]